MKPSQHLPGEARILCFDGGGVRGAFTARLVERLVRLRGDLLEQTFLFSGTSTGGLLALGYAAGKGPTYMVRMYEERARDIFAKRWLGGLWGPRYSADGLARLLEETFGKRTVAELDRFVLVPAYDLDAPGDARRPRSGRAKFFKSLDDDTETVVDVALATSAAPTYFPSHKGFVDGGVVANNPSTCAAAQAIDWGFSRDRLRVLSIGTGRSPHWIEGQDNAWGLVRWAPKLPSLMIDGVAGVADYQLRQVLGGHYHRLEADLPRPVELDDVDAIPELIRAADQVDLEPTLRWLEAVEWTR